MVRVQSSIMRHTRLTLALAAAAAIAAGATVPSVAFAASVEPASPPVAAEPARAPMKLLILPFASVTNADRDAWIGRAISEALTSDLSIDRALSVSTDKNHTVDNVNDAIAAAKQVGAQAVVYGTFQNVGENVRMTGQIVDVETAKAISGITATGPLQELFTLQDSLVHQIELRLGRPGLPAPPPQPTPPDSPLPVQDPNDGNEIFGVPKPPHHRPINWLDDEAARSDDFVRNQGIIHDDYFYNAPGPYYPVFYNPYYFPIGAVPFTPGAVLPPGWRAASPYYNPYFPQYYYPPVTVSVTNSDGDGWNGRTQTQGHGMVGGAVRATPKFQPYQLSRGPQFSNLPVGNASRAQRPNVQTEATTHQVGNRQMPTSSLPVASDVAARNAAAAASSSVRRDGGVARPVTIPPSVTTNAAKQQQQQQTTPPGSTARR